MNNAVRIISKITIPRLAGMEYLPDIPVSEALDKSAVQRH